MLPPSLFLESLKGISGGLANVSGHCHMAYLFLPVMFAALQLDTGTSPWMSEVYLCAWHFQPLCLSRQVCCWYAGGCWGSSLFFSLAVTPYHMGLRTELFVSCCLRAFAETPSLVSHFNLSVPVLISSCGWTGGAAVQVIDTTLCLGLFLWSKLCLLG